MLKSIAQRFSEKSRIKRGRIFKEKFQITEKTKLLDLGGGDGRHLNSVLKNFDVTPEIYIADINEDDLKHAQEKFGYRTILLNEIGSLPFQDGFFDLVFCSSVIEHVTLEKERVRRIKSSRLFSEYAYKRQKEFALEIQRIGKRFFVQTPHKYFPIESHTWMPAFVILLPRLLQIKFIDFMNKWWIKKTSPDWNLLTTEQMRQLFPNAEIVIEKSFGLTKSIIAVKI